MVRTNAKRNALPDLIPNSSSPQHLASWYQPPLKPSPGHWNDPKAKERDWSPNLKRGPLHCNIKGLLVDKLHAHVNKFLVNAGLDLFVDAGVEIRLVLAEAEIERDGCELALAEGIFLCGLADLEGDDADDWAGDC